MIPSREQVHSNWLLDGRLERNSFMKFGFNKLGWFLCRMQHRARVKFIRQTSDPEKIRAVFGDDMATLAVFDGWGMAGLPPHYVTSASYLWRCCIGKESTWTVDATDPASGVWGKFKKLVALDQLELDLDQELPRPTGPTSPEGTFNVMDPSFAALYGFDIERWLKDRIQPMREAFLFNVNKVGALFVYDGALFAKWNIEPDHWLYRAENGDIDPDKYASIPRYGKADIDKPNGLDTWQLKPMLDNDNDKERVNLFAKSEASEQDIEQLLGHTDVMREYNQELRDIKEYEENQQDAQAGNNNLN